MAAKSKTLSRKRVKLADLKTDYFVRKGLDQDWALYIGELMEQGVKFPNIIVTADLQVIDGRHRLEAFSLLNIEEILVEIDESITTEADLIAAAYKANTGGSKPPSKEDTEHTVMMLLDRKETISNIATLLGLPANLTRNLAKLIKAKTNKQKLARAMDAVATGGLTVAKAAELHGVEPDRLKDQISGKRKKKAALGIPEILANISTQYKGQGSRNAAVIRKLMNMLEDGEVTEKQVIKVIDHVQASLKQQQRSLEGWRKRLNGASGKSAK